jgi:hypothetical protein
MWFAFALAVLGAAMELFPYLQSFIEPRFYGIMFFVIGLIVAVLRFVTTQPIER